MQLTFLLLTHSFAINLGCKSSDLALHFNPRFNESVIVCNSLCSDNWQQEQRDKHFNFYKGSTVKVRALCWYGGCEMVGDTMVRRFPYPISSHLPAQCLPFPSLLPHPLAFWS